MIEEEFQKLVKRKSTEVEKMVNMLIKKQEKLLVKNIEMRKLNMKN